MKRFLTVLILLSITFSAFVGCNWQNRKTANAQLHSVLAKYTKQQIVFFKSTNIDHNQTVAFSVVIEQQTYEGDVWYVTEAGAQKLKSDLKFPNGNKPVVPDIWTVDNVTIFKCESEAGGSGSSSFAWYIKNGKPVALPYAGENLRYLGDGEFSTRDSDFDYGYTEGTAAGHTHKVYYLYWTADGLKEYGGLKITIQQLLKVKGTQAIIDVITKSGYTIGEIYYRANHTISINYHTGDKNSGTFNNITLAYKNNTVTSEMSFMDENGISKTESLNENNLMKFSDGGSYQAALFPKIATYPNQFPMN